MDGDCKANLLVCVASGWTAIYALRSGRDIQSLGTATEALVNFGPLAWATCGNLGADGKRELLSGAHGPTDSPEVPGHLVARSRRTGEVLLLVSRTDLE